MFDVYPYQLPDPRLTDDGTAPYGHLATQSGFEGASCFAALDFRF